MRNSLLLLILLLSTPCYAGTQADSLEWWLKGQNKFERAVVATEGEGQDFNIVEWRVKDVAKPSVVELRTIVSDYKAYLLTKPSTEETEKVAIETKLGLTRTQMKRMAELYR